MKQENNVSNGATLGEAPKKEVTIGEIEKWLSQDLSLALHCLNAIQSDVNIKRQIAVFMHGKLMNARHKEELERQEELKFAE